MQRLQHSGTGFDFANIGIQTKLKVSQPGDAYEREADRVAEHVMRMPVSDSAVPITADMEEMEISRKPSATSNLEAGDEVANEINTVRSSSGSSLDASTKEFMESRFGHDFSQVRIHADEAAARSSNSVNALAYTVGNDIVFEQGQYQPDTLQGRRLLAHELTHVLQQKNNLGFVQRLIRTPYPWQGIITSAIGANIRSSPDSSNPSNILDSIPRGEHVTVISNTGNWLQVESRYRGPALRGYIFHTLVDDATSFSMERSVGTSMVWKPSGPGSGTDFEAWASAATETPFPAVTSTTVMNCWEAVLLAAYQSHTISWSWIHNLYTSVPTADWVSAMTRGARHTYSVPGPNLRMPQRGDLVFFDGIAHVALATGNGSDVFTFWPPPDTPFVLGGTPDRVKVFTIESLVTWWRGRWPPGPTVEFGAPAW